MSFLRFWTNNGEVDTPSILYCAVIHMCVHSYILITISPQFELYHSEFCKGKNRVFLYALPGHGAYYREGDR